VKSLAVLHVSQLVTLAGPKRPRIGRELSELAIIRDGGILIRDGRIDVVGPSAEIEKKAGDAEVIDSCGKVVLPGFVDAHTHLVFAGNRLDDFERRVRGDTYEQIAKAGGGIWSTVEKTRAASEADLLKQAKKHADWFLRCGTTTVESKSGYGLSVEDELKILRVMRCLNQETPLEIVPTFLGAHAIPRKIRADEYVDLVVNEMLSRVTSDGLAEFCDVFCESGYFDIEQSSRILSAAKVIQARQN
jgi:imidazolonepropionase